MKTDSDLAGAVQGVPAFRCTPTSTGAWRFRCTCGSTHAHGAQPGHRVGHCASHKPGGYYLLPPTTAHRKD